MFHNYCKRSKLRLPNALIKACRFAYCDCHIGTKYEGREIEYCYECDDFGYEKEDSQ